jgi:hypothetical protein
MASEPFDTFSSYSVLLRIERAVSRVEGKSIDLPQSVNIFFGSPRSRGSRGKTAPVLTVEPAISEGFVDSRLIEGWMLARQQINFQM